MNIVLLVAFFVPSGSGLLTVDWRVDPPITHALNITTNLVDYGQVPTPQQILFITSNRFVMDVSPYLRQLPSTTAVAIITWEALYTFNDYMQLRFNVHLIVMITDPKLEVLRSVYGFKLTLLRLRLRLRSSCKIIAIIPGLSKLNQALVMSKVGFSFLKKHSILFLFSEFGAVYEYGANNLRNVTGKLLQADSIFERRKKFDGKVLKMDHMDDPPRSKVVDGRVTGLDGLFLDGYVKYMNTSYVVEKHFKRRNFTYEWAYITSLRDVLMVNTFDYVFPHTKLVIMFYMYGFTHQCLLVPKQPPISLMEEFLRILQPSLIIFLLVMFAIFGLVLHSVLRLRPKLRLGLFEIYFTLFQIAITNSVHHSKLRTLFERLSLMACIVLCFLIVSSAQSLLHQFLLFPIAKDIDTFDQLDRSNLKIIASFFNNYSLTHSFGDAFARKIVPVFYPSTEKINRSFAYMLNKEDVDRFYYSSANFVDGVQQMHRMEECLAKHYRGYLGPLDGYYEKSMHFYLQAIEESGIRHYWEQERSDKDNFERLLVAKEVAITFVHMKRVFNLLFIGHFAATLAFLVELIVNRVMKWRKG